VLESRGPVGGEQSVTFLVLLRHPFKVPPTGIREALDWLLEATKV
jgi:hypothetical protein